MPCEESWQPASMSNNVQSQALSRIPFRPRKIRRVSSPSKSATPSASAPLTHQVHPAIARPLSSDGEVEFALRHIRDSDPSLAGVIDSLAPPSFDSSSPPFISLTKSILYQQLATKAADAIYGRFLTLCGGDDDGEPVVSPETVLRLSAQQLRQVGVSGRKASYLHDLASKYRDGVLSDSSILEMEDETLLRVLTTVKGIGVWSVHMFMMFSLHRPDVLPVGDLGVRKGIQLLYKLKELPKPVEMEELCEKWKPYRSVGSWYMWRLMEWKSNKTLTPAK
ncbi:hypothetical protein SAY87_017202 [Trapa incisa]|uniref:HhH-GPD domain-containing protein n=1 Tax=Trapa incisa TaxID=236973 RepID=A0AAN7QY75_9MYRT|nr:hypothetical protein SAY87_017202 [Trapa incisa]